MCDLLPKHEISLAVLIVTFAHKKCHLSKNPIKSVIVAPLSLTHTYTLCNLPPATQPIPTPSSPLILELKMSFILPIDIGVHKKKG